MEQGYVALWRKSMRSRIFQNEGLWKVWTWCLMKATYKKKWVTLKTGKGNIEVEINPGEFVFGRNAAAKELKMAPSTVRNRMAKLKKLLNLDIKEDKQYSIVSIINWDTYQIAGKDEEQQLKYEILNPSHFTKSTGIRTSEELKQDSNNDHEIDIKSTTSANIENEVGQPKDKKRTSKGQPKDTNNKDNKKEKSICPQQAILDLYHSILPECTHHRVWDKERKTNLSARWNDKIPSQSGKTDSSQIEFWEGLFKYIRSLDFLMGKKKWQGFSLSWLIEKKKRVLKVVEGFYEDKD